ncbi:glutaredoxin 3 [bacterium]|nr:glutaredoxin 3 [bacterium]NCQ54842.1 glutaredoxin 3 [Candidatus Parcubacteria bacterium]NCS66886.1 glutaredoxin 3 [Candidatus Peregrinibacteria bacterium]NCS95832.1 glutaredoxin 3 [bacterium]
MKAVLYTKPTCPYCIMAKDLLHIKGIEFEDHDISKNPGLRKKISDSVGGYPTVPMIFLDGNFVGGNSELYALESAGKLG